ncbi:MAG: hypothetical protein CMH52_08420 [Myxococcales bacterium]|nr:hypothetical protein [Myxococcales bacterium]
MGDVHVVNQRLRSTLLLGLAVCMTTAAYAEKMPAHVFSGGGGKSQTANGSLRHFSAVGVGMAVGDSENGTHRAHHGFLGGARVFANQDQEPPVFDPPLADVEVAVGQDNCIADVEIPNVRATDDRDRNPSISLILVIDANREINVDPGETVGLEPGSYDVLAVATDSRGNETRGSFIIDVVDDVAPVVAAPIPNPTPVGGEAEATSPAGTRVAVNFTCRDNCDQNPDEGDVREVFPFGESQVQLLCTDESGNESATPVTIRVVDTQGPTVVGQVPDRFEIACNAADGARIAVPQVIWSDNGSLAQDLVQSLTINPGANEQSFNVLPDTITLAVGEHTLRYVATDTSNNSSTVDVSVVVTDTGVPRIEVSDLPETGWFGQDASFTFRVIDDCGAPDNLDVAIEPAPSNIVRNGNDITVSYEDDGRYALIISVTDEGGNTARDNSVSFGIDRTAPEVSITSPSQRGVDGDNTLTYPFFGQGQSLGLSVGAEDEGDGLPSGIRSIRVIADPGEFFQKVLAERTFNGAGLPIRGDRSVQNIACDSQEQIAGQSLCTDGAISLRFLEPGNRIIRIEAVDFAGNVGSTNAYFINSNLGAAMRRVRDTLNNIANPCDTCPANDDIDAAPLLRLARKLGDGAHMTDRGYAQAPYGTSIFLGGALKATQSAMADLVGLIRDTDDAAQVTVYTQQARMLVRAARSDLSLYNEWIQGMNPARGQARYVRIGYDVDMQFVSDNLDAMSAAIEGDQYSQAMSNAMSAFFHQKLAHQLWLMDYDEVPTPQEDVDGEVDRFSPNYIQYAKGRAVLGAIRDELTEYLGLINKPAEQTMTQIRNRLSAVVQSLDLLLDQGIANGLEDSEYLEALLDLRSVARNSSLAGNEGAYVRVYQFAIMQVVRWMTHFSLSTAQLFDDAAAGNQMYQYAQSSIDDGIQLLDNREIQAVINLYGDTERALCPIIGIYHCWFLRDEQALLNQNDRDVPIPDDDIPDECLDMGMLLPSEWAAAPEGDQLPQCRMTPPDGD